MSSFRVGVDIGGTFTDLVMMDENTGELRVLKLSSTPDDPARAFESIVARVLAEQQVEPGDVAYLVHGTTVATNAIIEGAGARTALVTTEGFRDVLEIARQIRPQLYDLQCDKPKPLVPRRWARGVRERLDCGGKVQTPLDEQHVREVITRLVNEGVESIAICLLHAYRNPVHERRVAELVAEVAPHVHISMSSDLCPEMREYYRASTTSINALVMPVMDGYLARIETAMASQAVTCGLHLMTSSGGMVTSAVARRQPVQMIESGPAAGVAAAAYLGGQIGIRDLISLDMGGTTAKAGLVRHGKPQIANHFEVGATAVANDRAGGYPVRTAVVDLVEIGAGGGSIAWMDPGGGLRVGPRSAGADPGPACYGRGNNEPTVTDANLILGRLNADYFIGGEMQLDPQSSQAAIERLAGQLNMEVDNAAHGILQIANANMLAAIRLVSVQRGFDPRDFCLVAFGGAGPVHAGALAHEADVARLLVPMSPGVASALGLLVNDVRHDSVRSCVQPTASADWAAIQQGFRELESTALTALAAERIGKSDQSIQRFLEMRYQGQSFELQVPVTFTQIEAADVAAIHTAFFAAHRQAYGYAAESEPTELVNLRIVASGTIPRPALAHVPSGSTDPTDAIKSQRPVYFAEAGGRVTCDIYDRYALRQNNRIKGPAIVEEIDSTTVIFPGYEASVDQFGNLVIEKVSGTFFKGS